MGLLEGEWEWAYHFAFWISWEKAYISPSSPGLVWHGSLVLCPQVTAQRSLSGGSSAADVQYGFGRVQVVPGVHACYGKEDAMMRGWVEWPQPEEGFSEMIDWQDE